MSGVMGRYRRKTACGSASSSAIDSVAISAGASLRCASDMSRPPARLSLERASSVHVTGGFQRAGNALRLEQTARAVSPWPSQRARDYGRAHSSRVPVHTRIRLTEFLRRVLGKDLAKILPHP